MNAVVYSPVLAVPAILGTPFAGGQYAGRFFVADEPFALILSPKDGGEIQSTKWGAARSNVSGALSYNDGQANTAAMAEAGSALGKWARGLRIAEHDDWYVPSRLEALMLFGGLREQFDREWYWTSSQVADDAQYAWYQNFYNGYQGNNDKGASLRARAVRRVAI